ncbi:MAG: hypothetical protein MN733_35415 [Nitrososphaera sp.]|nr:hypothetical protein [Nitrososphaera sp.]
MLPGQTKSQSKIQDEILARVYAVILSWPASEFRDGESTGEVAPATEEQTVIDEETQDLCIAEQVAEETNGFLLTAETLTTE